ncbi:thioredoxin 2 [Apophysomyces sp. BC1015]|nr:thioredoxin 2 [Apophysomyces sp. BC1015]
MSNERWTIRWCGPCKVLTPILTKTVAANPNVTLVKVNVDDMMDISSKYKIAALPTVKAFHNSEVVDEFVGMRNVAQCQEFVKKHAERAK